MKRGMTQGLVRRESVAGQCNKASQHLETPDISWTACRAGCRNCHHNLSLIQHCFCFLGPLKFHKLPRHQKSWLLLHSGILALFCQIWALQGRGRCASSWWIFDGFCLQCPESCMKYLQEVLPENWFQQSAWVLCCKCVSQECTSVVCEWEQHTMWCLVSLVACQCAKSMLGGGRGLIKVTKKPTLYVSPWQEQMPKREPGLAAQLKGPPFLVKSHMNQRKVGLSLQEKRTGAWTFKQELFRGVRGQTIVLPCDLSEASEVVMLGLGYP